MIRLNLFFVKIFLKEKVCKNYEIFKFFKKIL